MYRIAGIDLSERGIMAGRASDSSFAISGAWDMPSRIGKIFHEWPDEDGVEPYLRQDEIFYSGRDIVFTCYVVSDSREGAYIVTRDLFDEIDGFDNLVLFECEWGAWNVSVQKQIDIKYIGSGYCKCVITFRQPVVDLSGVVMSGTSMLPGIDGVSFLDLGLTKVKTEKQFNRPAAKAFETTIYGYESYTKGFKGLREFSIRFVTRQKSYSDFLSVVTSLYAIFSSPGARTLKLDDGTTREVFIKDGFQVSEARKLGDGFFAFIDIQFSEIRILTTWNRLINSDLLLVDKNGQPLSEIIKKN